MYIYYDIQCKDPNMDEYFKLRRRTARLYLLGVLSCLGCGSWPAEHQCNHWQLPITLGQKLQLGLRAKLKSFGAN